MSAGKKAAATNVFTHVMVAHVVNESAYYRDMTDVAASPTMAFLFAINIPSGVGIPNNTNLTATQAQSFTLLPSDQSLIATPQFIYPVKKQPNNRTISAPLPQSTIWPVDIPKQPLYLHSWYIKTPWCRWRAWFTAIPRLEASQTTLQLYRDNSE